MESVSLHSKSRPARCHRAKQALLNISAKLLSNRYKNPLNPKRAKCHNEYMAAQLLRRRFPWVEPRRNSWVEPCRANGRRRALVALALGAALLAPMLSGCSGGNQSASAPGIVAPGAVGQPGAPAGGNFGAADMAAGGSADGGMREEAVWVDETPAGREVITSGFVSIAAADPLPAAGAVAALVSRVGGFIENRNESQGTEGNPGSAFLSARIPSDRVNEVIDGLAGVGGEVRNVEISRQDVTAQAVDLDARILALQASTDRLLGLMNAAGNVEDLLRAERELSSRQADLDALRSARAHLSDQVQMSRLDINIFAPTSFATPRTGFVGALERGWSSLLVSGRWLIVALGTLLPWLLALGLLWYLIRLALQFRRKRRIAKLDPEFVEELNQPTLLQKIRRPTQELNDYDPE